MSEQWYYTKERQQTGPVDFAKLKELATTGQIAATDLVWKAGMLSWLPASQIPGLLSEGPPLVPDVPAWLVLLEWFQADKKIPLIKELQRLAGVPISRGKQLLEKCPCLIHTAPLESEAYSLKAALEAIGAGVSLWNDRVAMDKRCRDIPQIKAKEKNEADKQRQELEKGVRDFSKWLKSGGMQAEFDGCGPCTKCGHIFQMHFANAVCPKCRHKMSREDAFFSCGSYPHSSPPQESKSSTTPSTTPTSPAREGDAEKGEQTRKSALVQAMLNQYRAQTGAPAPAHTPSVSVSTSSLASSLPNTPADWYYMKHGTRFGPFSAAQIGSMLAAKQILTNDVLWHDSLDEWVPAIRVAVFHGVLRTVVKETGPVICKRCARRFDSLFLLKQACIECADDDGANWHTEFSTWLGELDRNRCFTGGWLGKKRPKCPNCGTSNQKALSLASKQHIGTTKVTIVDSMPMGEVLGETLWAPYTVPVTRETARYFVVCISCRAAWAVVLGPD